MYSKVNLASGVGFRKKSPTHLTRSFVSECTRFWPKPFKTSVSFFRREAILLTKVRWTVSVTLTVERAKQAELKIWKKRPHPWDTHYRFSIKTLLSKIFTQMWVCVRCRLHSDEAHTLLYFNSFLDGYCSTVQGLLDWFEVDPGFPELFLLKEICGTRITLFSQTRQIVRYSAVTTLVDKERMNPCVPKHLFFEGVKQQPKKTRLPRNAPPDALLKSRFQNFAADAAANKPRLAHFD